MILGYGEGETPLKPRKINKKQLIDRSVKNEQN